MVASTTNDREIATIVTSRAILIVSTGGMPRSLTSQWNCHIRFLRLLPTSSLTPDPSHALLSPALALIIHISNINPK